MEELRKVVPNIAANFKADIFLFNGKINDNNADDLIMEIREVENRKENILLILTTDGGDPDAGFRIARAIKEYYKNGKFILFVFGFCKSTGTLIALGANEIVMGDLAEFGPLDIQLAGGDEFTNMSGLSYLQSLIALNEKIYTSFEENFINLKQYGITTKTAAEIGSKLAIGIIEPIAAQIDPTKLGDVQRAIKIASAYGERILGTDSLELNSVLKLIANYPSHSFVIDFEEMKQLFPKRVIRRPTEEEYVIQEELAILVRREQKKTVIVNLVDLVMSNEKQNENEQQKVENQPPVAGQPIPEQQQHQGNGHQ